jgi:hypothetical protein
MKDSLLRSYWKFSGRYESRENPLCKCGKPHVFKIYVAPDGEEWPLMMEAGTELSDLTGAEPDIETEKGAA